MMKRESSEQSDIECSDEEKSPKKKTKKYHSKLDSQRSGHWSQD